ncbi:MAG: ClpXP protease specificity-enhancing factor [Betaproteobacteria bacterium]|nr:ClpXP protease specificity-enhancing factor [Betaproteobacteria bacterium]
MPERSTKPYLIRAIHEWCTDSGFTPYLSVKVDENTRVPAEYVKSGEIVLNLSHDATHKLTITNDLIQFSARFSGVSRECSVPMVAVAGIFARENGQGLFFALEQNGVTQGVNGVAGGDAKPQAAATTDREPTPPSPTRPKLQIVK